MAKALRLLEQLTGEKLIYTRALPGDRKDWEAHQDRLEAQAAEVLARWTPESDEPQPEPFIRKKRPKWLADRIKGDTGNVR
jgi:hypothetical protein